MHSFWSSVLWLLLLSMQCSLGASYRLFATESPSYYFTKRPNLLHFDKPMSIADSSILVVKPIKGLWSGAILCLRRENLQSHPGFSRVSTEHDPLESSSNDKIMTGDASKSSFVRHLFGNPWWTPKKSNQELRKIRASGIVNRSDNTTNNQNDDFTLIQTSAAIDRTKRLHALSLLRSYNIPILSLRAKHDDAPLRHVLSRKKRVHTLSILRGYNLQPANGAPIGMIRLQRALQRSPRGIHNLSLLLKRSKRSLHNLSLLRGYNNAQKIDVLQPQSEIARQSRSRRSLHNLSLLRGYNNAHVLASNVYAATQQPDISDQLRVQLGRKSKRVHSLSLLRYDGKLFQNLYSSQDAEKRFQQKRYSYY